MYVPGRVGVEVVVPGVWVSVFGLEASAEGLSGEAAGAGEGNAAGELAGPLLTAAIKFHFINNSSLYVLALIISKSFDFKIV